MRLNLSFNMWSHVLDIHLQKRPLLYTIGITNETEDCRFVPFFDLDNIYRETAEKYVRMAQRDFGLSPAILLSSSGERADEKGRLWGNYMAIMFDKLKYVELMDILSAVPVIDFLSLKMPPFYRYKSWVLRMADKFDAKGNVIVKRPKYVETIFPDTDDFKKNKHSEAHYRFLQKLFNFKGFSGILNMDGYYELTFIRYNTKGKEAGKKVKTGIAYYPEFRKEFR